MTTWKRLTQTTNSINSKSYFLGEVKLTKRVCFRLSLEEILFILRDIKAYIAAKGCIENNQTYEDDRGRRLVLIDSPEDNFIKLKFITEE